MEKTETSLERINALYEFEREQNGMIEMAFCPGTEREFSNEEAATVVLALIGDTK